MDKSRWISAVVATVGTAIVIALYSFNRHHPMGDEYLVTNISGLLWLPMMLIILVFRREPSDFGFAPGDARKGYVWAGVLYALLFPLMLYASQKAGYQSYYPMDSRALLSLADFLRFELVYGVYLFCWEFFFRGFLLFGLGRSVGVWSILIQTIPFGIMHAGKPEFLPSFFSGIVLGILAWRSKSFMPCFILHWAISLTFDIMVVVAAHKLPLGP